MTNQTTRALGRLGFIGAGAVASQLARALAALDYPVVAVTARTLSSATMLAQRIPNCRALTTPAAVAAASDTVFIAVSDDQIETVAAAIHWRADQAAIHLSGARGAEALAAALAQGARVAALHPLMAFPRALRDAPLPAILARLRGCTWALESPDDHLGAELDTLVQALGGRVLPLTANDRIPYHLAAVLVSNYVVTLMGAAVRVWATFGVDAPRAQEALLPLLRAAVDNLEAPGLPQALTGPVARGDLGTLDAHLAWLTAHVAGERDLLRLRDAYIALARLSIPIALEKGSLSREAAEALQRLLTDAWARPLAPPPPASRNRGVD